MASNTRGWTGRILATYTYAGGWSTPRRTEDLTPETAARLKATGHTMVRVRRSWRQIREVSLQQYLDRHTPQV